MSIEENIYRGLTGRSPRSEMHTFGGQLGALLAHAGGTRSAAAQLAVSQRTIQRWLAGTQRPSKAAAARLAALQRRLRLAPTRERRLRRANNPLVRIELQISADTRTRDLDGRNLKWAVDGVGDIIDWWIDGDDSMVRRAFLEAIDDHWYRDQIINNENDIVFIRFRVAG